MIRVRVATSMQPRAVPPGSAICATMTHWVVMPKVRVMVRVRVRTFFRVRVSVSVIVRVSIRVRVRVRTICERRSGDSG